MIKTPLYILLSIVVFVITALILYKILGSPDCDSMANQTAFQLKLAIDEVAKDPSEGGPPFYRDGGVPENPVYYKVVPIRLCQQYGEYSYLKSFMGGEPEYKIYYEVFPEGFFKGGALLWSENYPWSGSAASSFVFWGAMRGVTVAGKLVTKISTAHTAWKGLKMLSSLKAELDDFREVTLLDVLRNTEKFQEQVAQISDFVANNDLNKLAEGLAKKDAQTILNGLKKAGILKKVGDDVFAISNKLVVNADEVPVTAIVKVKQADGTYSLLRKAIAFKQDASKPAGFDFTKVFTFDYEEGKVLPLTIDDPPGLESGHYVTQMIRPSDAMRDMINELKTTDRAYYDMLNSMYAYSNEEGSIVGNSLDDAIKPSLTDRIYQKTVGKVKTFLKDLERKFFNIKDTVYDPLKTSALADGVMQGMFDTTFGKDVQEQVFDRMKDIGVWDKIKTRINVALGRETWEEVAAGQAKDYFEKIYKETGFVGALEEHLDLNVVGYVADQIWKDPNLATDQIRDLTKANVPKFAEIFSSVYDDTTLDALIDRYKIIYSNTPGIRYNFMTAVDKDWIIDLALKLRDSTDPEEKIYALKQLGSVIALFEHDTSTMPITSLKGGFAYYGIKELKKIALIEGRAFVTPTNYIGKGIMGEWSEGCQGNSICIYSHGARMEYPFYLDEDAQNFAGRIKVWRPVEAWQQYLGWQAALQHIPPHPRFYVVSPCYAIAKIWKAEYMGEDDIFIYPEKIDMNDTASNYCYADSNLINAYTAIWFTSDVLTVIETVVTWGISSGKFGTQAAKISAEAAGKTAAQQFAQVWKVVDPVTLGQTLAEAAISWPGWPYKSLDYDKMLAATPQTTVTQIQK
jgi:hypothetical protein